MPTRPIAALALTTTLAGLGPALAQDGPEAQGEPDGIDPCEGGFYLADANRDGTITPAELEEAALAAFARFDADGSGEVTRAEYEACANAGAGVVGVPAQRVKSNLPEYDVNGDGQLSQAEFMQAAGDAYDQARIEANLGSGESAARRQDADIAGAGESMTGAEGARTGTPPVVVLQRFLFIPESERGTDPARMSREEATQRALQAFAALDTDRSGRLDPVEWAKRRAVRLDMADLMETRFNRDDIDTSGSLTPEEFIAGEERRRQQAQERLGAGPDDADGAGSAGSDGANPPVVYYRYPHVM